jgi:hypothetical protein
MMPLNFKVSIFHYTESVRIESQNQKSRLKDPAGNRLLAVLSYYV